MKIKGAWSRAKALLADESISDAGLEAEVLLRHVLNMGRATFFASLDDPVDACGERELQGLIRKRLEGVPLAYIVGHREFYGLDLMVGPSVLVPRQETEVAVEKALELCSTVDLGRPVRVADVGTGSGAIAVAIATHAPDAVVYAVDACREALTVADVNRRRFGVRNRVRLVQADLLEPFDAPFDLIVSNPPYVRTEDIPGLAPEVRREPAAALDGGADGLEPTRRLLSQAARVTCPGGSVLIEVAPERSGEVGALAERAMGSGASSIVEDLLGLPRLVVATRAW